ncbi:hypothetical protein [Paenarthrobacter sp. TA1.8]|uniref:hypothetical protein n=1 Tax=Paenarthrobacter sp. TA1.8 TaxID=3400219 RepID=UPI003B42C413
MKAISSVRATQPGYGLKELVSAAGIRARTGWRVPNNDAAIPIQVLSESLMARMKNHQIEWNEAVQPEPVSELGPPLSIR